MDANEFQTELRRLRWQEPFRPFVVELANGARVEVLRADGLVFNGGAGTYHDGETFHDLRSRDVVRIAELPQREIRAMTVEEFEAELRRLRWQEPFRPFAIELKSGQRIEIDSGEGLAFSGGAAVFINADGEPIDFDFEDVARIIEPQGATSV